MAARKRGNEWGIAPGVRVRFQPTPDRPADEPPPPAGVWKVIDKADRQSYWWVIPWDSEARNWAGSHPDYLTSGCIDVWTGAVGPADYMKV